MKNIIAQVVCKQCKEVWCHVEIKRKGGSIYRYCPLLKVTIMELKQ